jgi:hypothetical protein
MHTFDHYGIKINDAAAMAQKLTPVLGVKFSPHESSFWGEYFLGDIGDVGNIRIISNFYDGDWREEDYREYPLLLEVNEAICPNEIMMVILKIKGIDFLYRSEVEGGEWIRRYKYESGNFHMVGETIL